MNTNQQIIKYLTFFSICSLFLIVVNFSYYNISIKNYKELENKYNELMLDYVALQDVHYSLHNNYLELSQEKEFDKIKLLSYIEPLKEYDRISYLTQYKAMIEEYPLLFNHHNLSDEFSEQQIQLMYQCIETETYQCDIIGKINVASVILNRLESNIFPNDPISVITAPNQFAYHRQNISNETILALEYAYLVGDTTNGCVSFRSDSAPTRWGNWYYQFTDKVGHNFYK